MKLSFGRLFVGALMVSAVAACSGTPETERRSTVEHGRDLFTTTAAAESKANRFACATCHATTADSVTGRILSGARLAGAVDRPTFWGGNENDLLRAINQCRYYFMGASRSWTAADEPAKAMYAFLAGLPREAADAQPFTVQAGAADLPAGDAARGAQVYDSACRACHGAPSTGDKRLREGIPTLPEESARYFASLGFDRNQTRITFVEKVRHGAFLGLYGTMPPFSKESMSDADLAALLAFFALY